MPKRKKDSTPTTNNGATLGHEGQLWQAANALRGSMDAAEYKHVNKWGLGRESPTKPQFGRGGIAPGRR